MPKNIGFHWSYVGSGSIPGIFVAIVLFGFILDLYYRFMTGIKAKVSPDTMKGEDMISLIKKQNELLEMLVKRLPVVEKKHTV